MKRYNYIKYTFTLFFFFLCLGSYAERIYYAEGTNGAVSCGHHLASKASIEILKKGGNAVDAAVTAAFTLAVVEPSNSGLGGEGFALICNSQGQAIAIDGSTRRPQNDIKNEYKCQISLPAIPEMLIKIHRLYGKLPLRTLLKPAIELSEKGFRVSSYLADTIIQNRKRLVDSQAKALLFPNNKPLKAGEILKQPSLSKTLKQLATDEGLSFYYGNQASQIIKDMNSRGSSYTKLDFMSYKSRFCKPVKANYKNYSLLGHPLPSSSAITLGLALYLLESGIELNPHNASEAIELTEAYRNFIEFKHLKSAQYYSQSQNILASTKMFCSDNSKFLHESNDSNTTHLCVWDKNNLVVSMTLTLGNHFGTGELSPGGFFYANSLRTFSNTIVKYPGNYPSKAGSITSKSPIIVTKNQKPFLALGGAGADRIITNTATVLANCLSDKNLYQAIQSPRYFRDYNNNVIVELDSDNKTFRFPDSASITFKVKPNFHDYFGLIGIIQKEKNLLKTVGDKRRDGSCLSY